MGKGGDISAILCRLYQELTFGNSSNLSFIKCIGIDPWTQQSIFCENQPCSSSCPNSWELIFVGSFQSKNFGKSLKEWFGLREKDIYLSTCAVEIVLIKLPNWARPVVDFFGFTWLFQMMIKVLDWVNKSSLWSSSLSWPGLQKLLDVLRTWADPGPCSASAYVMIFQPSRYMS